jgi:hypothetical protein
MLRDQFNRPIVGGYMPNRPYGAYQSDDDPIPLEVNTKQDLSQLYARLQHFAVGAAVDPNKFVAQAAMARIGNQALVQNGVSTSHAAAITHLSNVAQMIHSQLGVLDADYLRRPNLLVGVYGTTVAPGATLAFTITPSGGTSWYRLLAFLAGDDQAQIFGFTSLKCGGLDQIFATQATPTAPIANATGWMGFVARGDGQKFNIQPWTGQVFDNSVQVTGTIANMSVAGTGDAITLNPRFLIPSQTDPCGQNSAQVVNSAANMANLIRKQVGFHSIYGG